MNPELLMSREAMEWGRRKQRSSYSATREVQVVCGNSKPSPYGVKLHPPGSGLPFSAQPLQHQPINCSEPSY